MILPDHLRTANQILHRAGLDVGDGRRTAAALIAVHLANLPPEPEMWGATPEPMSSEDHMHAAVLSACRTIKAVGWVPDAMTVAILATAEVGSAYAAWTRPEEARRRREMETANKPAGIAARSLAQMRVAAEVYAPPGDPALTEDEDRAARHAEYMTRCAGLDDAAVVDKVGYEMGRVDLVTHMVRERERAEHKLRDLAGVATVATEEPEAALVRPWTETPVGRGITRMDISDAAPAVDTTVPDETVTTAPPIVGHVVDVVSVEDPDVSPTGRGGVAGGDPFVTAGVEPAQEKPRKPRCPLTYEGIDGTAVPCGRPVEHKGACGPAKVVGKAKAAEVGS